MYKRILVAADTSPLSKKAVNHAIALAVSTGAELVVLTVTQRYPTSYMEGAMVFDAVDVAKIEKQWVEQGRALVDRYV
ncbi:MAG: universal stress protein, partial [Comamonadaceae bacterium]